ncbi:hypothetical protein L6164_037362 [Bauhinia variegata]|uniref:Uncharacterized protein n=1 Tax=Bauhinia variegata TaxID=167791 RepID=A0ACB9KJT1_BAUVA|nr:hypothetical protein L6164_037362 [Bauhinia variegata]
MAIKERLSSNFEMKDVHEANYILGVKIQRGRSKKLVSLSQKNCLMKILEKFHMIDCKPMDTSVNKSESFNLEMCPQNKTEENLMKRVLYSSTMGSLMYAMLCTRLDICHVVGLVSRYQPTLERNSRKQ